MKVAYYPAGAGEQSLADVGLASPAGGTVVTIGAFDGVHLGHRRLIERVRTTAHEIGALSAVLTFDRHPASVVRPGSAPLLLTVTCPAGTLDEAGSSFVSVVIPNADGPCDLVLKETVVQYVAVPYTLTIGPEGG